MKPSRICPVIAISLIGLQALAQKPRLDLAPKTPPLSCGIALASTATITGSPAYLRLRFQLEALGSAQDAVIAMAAGMEGLKDTVSPPGAMSSAFTADKQAHDALLCAASIIDRYRPENETDKNSKILLIVAYNQEANAVSDFDAHIKERFLRSAKNQTTTMQVKDAERITAINSLQQEAAESLTQITILSLMEADDLGDPTAQNTAQTTLSCTEFEDLFKRSADLAHGIKSAYSDSSGLFLSFFNGHKCRA